MSATLALPAPSCTRSQAAAFGFFVFSQVFTLPLRYGAVMRFDTMPSRPSLQGARKYLGRRQ
jgi:hypothetical protein